MGPDLDNLSPGDPHSPPASDPGGDAPEEAGSPAPDPGPAEDRHDLRIVARAALDDEIVDVAAAASLAVDQLVVEDAEREIEFFAHDCPTFVRIMSGIAESDTVRMISR